MLAPSQYVGKLEADRIEEELSGLLRDDLEREVY